jgi:proteasome lid subunit RPN8/RPN11
MHKVGVKPTALKTMLEHGKSQLESGLEVGGVITGRVENGYTVVTHAIPLSVGEKTAVEITSELFAEAYRIKEESGIEDPIIGWYHSHPGYSCFMSEMDRQAHQRMLNLYKDAIALVLDPLLYTDNKPSSEYFKVFTLFDGRVKEIPSDIDGSRKSKDDMFRGFVSGKETVVERVIYKQPERRSWAHTASVALILLILAIGIIAVGRLGKIEEDLADDGRIGSQIYDMKDSIDTSVDTKIDDAKRLLEEKFESSVNPIMAELEQIRTMVEDPSFTVTLQELKPTFLGDPVSFTVKVENTGNIKNTYTIEIPEFPNWAIDPPQVDLERGETASITISTESFTPLDLVTRIFVKVTNSQGEPKEIPVTLRIEPRIGFIIGGDTLSPQLSAGEFKYSKKLIPSEEGYTVEVKTASGEAKSLFIEFEFAEDQISGINVIVDDEQLEPGVPFELFDGTIISIELIEDAGRFVLNITVIDESGESYILELIFEQESG